MENNGKEGALPESKDNTDIFLVGLRKSTNTCQNSVIWTRDLQNTSSSATHLTVKYRTDLI
jgi:hypothetical protein